MLCNKSYSVFHARTRTWRFWGAYVERAEWARILGNKDSENDKLQSVTTITRVKIRGPVDGRQLVVLGILPG